MKAVRDTKIVKSKVPSTKDSRLDKELRIAIKKAIDWLYVTKQDPRAICSHHGIYSSRRYTKKYRLRLQVCPEGFDNRPVLIFHAYTGTGDTYYNTPRFTYNYVMQLLREVGKYKATAGWWNGTGCYSLSIGLVDYSSSHAFKLVKNYAGLADVFKPTDEERSQYNLVRRPENW